MRRTERGAVAPDSRPFGSGTTATGLAALALDSSDRVTATGTAAVQIEVTSGKGKKKKTEIQTVAGFVTIRLDSAGNLDASFGVGGVARIGLPDRNETWAGVALQADGRILMAGTVTPVSSGGSSLLIEYAYVARFDASGALDSTFGIDGIRDSLPIADRHFVDGIALAPDGGIHIAGIVDPVPSDSSERNWYVARLCD